MSYAGIYGIGKGSAQVWGENVALDHLEQTFEQDRKRREKDEAELQAQVSKIDISKVRQPDQEDAYALYDDVKNLFRQYQNTTNHRERRRIEGEMDIAKKKAIDFSVLSQTAGQRELELYKARMSAKTKLHRDYTPNYVALTSARIADPTYKTLAEKATTNIYAAEFDEDKFLKNVELRAVEQLNDPKLYTERVAGGTRSYELKGSRVNTEKLAMQVTEQAKTDEGLRDRIAERSPDVPFADAVKNYIGYTQELLESKNKVEKRSVTIDKDDSWREKMLFKALLDKDKSETPQGSSAPILIPFNNGESKVQSTDYRGISISKKNFVGSEYIDLKTGKPAGKLDSSSDYEIVGVGNFPILKGVKDKKGNLSTLNGSVSQPEFQDRRPENIEQKPMVHVQLMVTDSGGKQRKKDVLVPYDKLPLNVKNSKAVKEALSGFKTVQNTSTSSTTNQNKVVSSGYTNTQFLQDAKGNKIEAGVKNGKWYNTKTGKAIE